jgi:hypothetical protein
MLKRNLVLRLVSAMAIALAIASFPGLGYAASPLSLPPAGMGSIVLVNMDGGNEILSVNFAGTMFSVPPQGSSSPNQVEFNLPPGTYSYTASVAGVGSVTNTINVVGGRVISLAFSDNLADLANGDQNGDDQSVTTQQIVAADNDNESAESDENNESQTEQSNENSRVSNNFNAGKFNGNTFNNGKGNNLPFNAGKTNGNTFNNGKGNNLPFNAGQTNGNTFNNSKGNNLPFNAGKTNGNTNSGKGNNSTFNAGKTNGNTNSGKGNNSTFNTCNGNTFNPACNFSGGGGNNGKRSDILTVSYTPNVSGPMLNVANDGGHGSSDGDENGDNEGSEQTVTTVTTPAFDNDELLVTVTDVTALAQ